MRKFKNRLQKKYIQRARDGLKHGNPSPFYMRRTQLFIQRYMDRHYLTVFFPWWYEQEWGEMDFLQVHTKYYEDTFKELGEKINIDLKQLGAYFRSNPRPEKINSKPRKDKPSPPVRKLKQPQEFVIKVYQGGVLSDVTVIGEVAFQYEGYQFFVHRYGDSWRVSDVVCGKKLAVHDRYKQAVKIAKERIASNIASYIDQVNKQIVH